MKLPTHLNNKRMAYLLTYFYLVKYKILNLILLQKRFV